MKAKLSDGSAVVVLIGDMNDPSKSGIRPRVDPFQTQFAGLYRCYLYLVVS